MVKRQVVVSSNSNHHHHPNHLVIIVIKITRMPRHGHKCAAINPVALEEPKPAPELDPSRLSPKIIISVINVINVINVIFTIDFIFMNQITDTA